MRETANTVPPRAADAPGRVSPWLVAGSYALLTAVFWGTFVFERGLHADTGYIEISQTSPGWRGFLYPFDSTRMFMMVPFHLGYLLSGGGSYLGLHLVFGAFVWLTGWLTYLVVKAFVPHAELLAFAAGAIALVHGGDDYVNLVSMNMVRQCVVCVLLAILLFRVSWLKRRPILFVPIALVQVLALWTYEAGLAVLIAAPLVIASRSMPVRRFIVWSLVWSIVPAVNVASIIYRYVIRHEVSYQSQELMGHFSIHDIATRLWALAFRGTAFWTWPDSWLAVQSGCVGVNLRRFLVPMVVGIVAFVVAAAVVARAGNHSRNGPPGTFCFLGACTFLALSYAPYLVLSPDRFAPAWRTQFFAAPAAAILIAGVAMQVDAWVSGRAIIATAIGGYAVGAGLYCGLASQWEQTMRWVPYRNVMTAIVNAAPRIRDDTFVAVVATPSVSFHTLCENAPVPNPPFEDEIWFNSGLRVLYPGTRLVGMFWRGDLLAPGSLQFTFDAQGAKLLKTSMPVGGTAFRYDQMIAFAYDAHKGAVLLSSFPSRLIPGAAAATGYDPARRILPGPPPETTARKLLR